MLNDIEMRKLEISNETVEVRKELSKMERRFEILEIRRKSLEAEEDMLNELAEARNVAGK